MRLAVRWRACRWEAMAWSTAASAVFSAEEPGWNAPEYNFFGMIRPAEEHIGYTGHSPPKEQSDSAAAKTVVRHFGKSSCPECAFQFLNATLTDVRFQCAKQGLLIGIYTAFSCKSCYLCQDRRVQPSKIRLRRRTFLRCSRASKKRCAVMRTRSKV